MIFDRQNFADPEEKRTTTHTHTHIKKDEATNKQTNSKGERGEKEGGTVPKMRTGQLSSVGNYRGARSELQSGQDPASKRQKVRERENGRGKRGGGDAIFTPIYGEIPGRGTLTTSKQDLWKTPGDLRYHYLPRSGTVFRWTLMPA